MMDSRRFRIHIAAIGHRFPDAEIERAVMEGHPVTLDTFPGRSFDEVAEHLQQAEVVMIGTLIQLTSRELQQLPNLRGIVRYGIGVDNLDLEACQRLGIAVCNVPDYATDEVATHAVGLLLTLARQIVAADTMCKTDGWLRAATELRPRSLEGATLGIVGVGRIGRRLLELSACFPWQRIAYDPAVEAGELRAMGLVPAADLDQLLATSDLLTLHLPALAGTPLLGAAELDLLPSGCLIVNCARGALIDSEALAARLKSGAIGGVGLDVLDIEPMPPDHPLHDAPNVIVTGHTAWMSERSKRTLRSSASEEALRLVLGQPPRNPVVPVAG